MQLVLSKPVSNWRADVQILVQEIVSPQEIAWMDDDGEDAVYVRRAIKEVQVRLKKDKAPQTIAARMAVAKRLARLPCILAHCDGSDCASHIDPAASCVHRLLPVLAHLCDPCEEEITPALKRAVLDALASFLRHHSCDTPASLEQPTRTVMYGLVDKDRGVRMAAGRAMKALFAVYDAGGMATARMITPIFDDIYRIANQGKAPITETLLLSVCAATKAASAEILGQGLCFLIAQLARQNPMIKGVAFTQIQSMARHHNFHPHRLYLAHIQRIAPYVAARVCSQPSLIIEVCRVFEVQRDDFIAVSHHHTLPPLFAACEGEIIEQLFKIVATKLSFKELLNSANLILAHIFRMPSMEHTEKAIQFLIAFCERHANREDDTLQNIPHIYEVSTLTELVVDLGSSDEETRAIGAEAIARLQEVLGEGKLEQHVWLKNKMLGVISCVGNMLQDKSGKKTAEQKRMILRGLGAFISRVGPAIRHIAPQIMACYQSVISAPELTEATLESWLIFLQTLEWADIGEVVGTTSSTFVLNWPSFSPDARRIVRMALEYLVPDGENTLGHALRECADFSAVEELKDIQRRLDILKMHMPASERLDAILARAVSLNMTVALQAHLELRSFAMSNKPFFARLASGDMFDPLIGKALYALITSACRNGDDNGQIRALAFECMGIIGAMDPDRCELPPVETSMIVMKDFEDEEEAIAFVISLLQNLLVVTFRTATDTSFQNTVAFIIQELMKFCKFVPELVSVDRGAPVSIKVKNRWNSLPKFVSEVITPYLDGRLSIGGNAAGSDAIELPIYSRKAEYREWMQHLSFQLIKRITQETASRVFYPFRLCVRHHDVVIPHHLLPHLVLHLLISGSENDIDFVMGEIIAVLEDVANPESRSTPEKRLLSAQAVFMLLDHLNKWIRLTRQDIAKRKKMDKSRKTTVLKEEGWLVRVDSALCAINEKLMAEAALESRSYARALMGFERLTRTLRERNMAHPDLPTYYERLHELYSHLDEPDGMEGVSTLILSPSLEHQIREHESTGRWTSAQSCWEVRLQQSPDDISFHLGLLRCLRNLGHYDTLRTHVRGVLVRHPEWESTLAGYAVESAWMVGAWDDVAALTSGTTTNAPQVLIAKVMLAMREDDAAKVNTALEVARAALGRTVVAAGVSGYRRSYEATLDLHMTHELELIYRTSRDDDSVRRRQGMSNLMHELSTRLNATFPAFRIREPVLSMRRAAFSMDSNADSTASDQVGRLWLSSSKIARKAGQWQTAYSALLQAQQSKAPYSFIESAKYVKAIGEPLRALQELENSMKLIGILDDNMYDLTVDQSELKAIKAKAHLLRARWMNESDRYDPSTILKSYTQATDFSPQWENGQFRLGQFHDNAYKDVLENTPRMASKQCRMLFHVVKAFAKAMRFGSKYIYQTVPRLLTIWLDISDNPEVLANTTTEKQKREPIIIDVFRDMCQSVEDAIKKVPAYKWYTAFPQIVSRIGLQNGRAYQMLSSLVCKVISEYPNQALWLFASVVKSKQELRRTRGMEIMAKLRHMPSGGRSKLAKTIASSELMTTNLLRVCEYGVNKATSSLSLSKQFPELNKIGHSNLIIPLQESMTASLPPASGDDASHKPFPDELPTFNGFNDEIDVMATLAKPRKITIRGSDGHTYMFLGKPKDDLRKDARLMDLYAMINKLFKADSESRRRQLQIRTYGVITLNEECGFIQWVPNVTPIRPILTKLWASRGIPPYVSRLSNRCPRRAHTCVYPPVFHEHFLETFPEPTAWLTSRLNFSHTSAVMSMVGYIIGLGDRHLENILLDINTGQAIHVDFNCLFEKGKALTVPELVPFRLTQNIVDAMGVTGVEGFYRISCEVTMKILRDNKDSIMSVLDAFIHDPLVEWEEDKRNLARRQERQNANAIRAQTDLNALAHNALGLIGRKLRGEIQDKRDSSLWKEVSTGKLVQSLIEEATSPTNLGRMYPGWGPWA
ncbi:hypothetical protein GGG16DRAFT_56461 [Schizophyllum commune]